jgi:hypothetical protein
LQIKLGLFQVVLWKSTIFTLFFAPIRSFLIDLNYSNKKTFTFLKPSTTTQSSSIPSSLLAPCYEKKDPQLVTLLDVDGGLLAFLISS